MKKEKENNKRIAKNTLLLYFRMLFIMIVSLYTSRINLQSLGISDFGIYNVVGGVVAMFSIFSGSLATACSRFLSYELGKGNKDTLSKVFSTTVSIHILLAICIVIIMEPVGLWFMHNKLVIPTSRLYAANWVFQFSVMAFVVNMISVPYNSAIIAHENMSAFAYISIFEVVSKLIICFFLFISPFDKLIVFAALLLFLALSLRILYGFYCKKHFKECTYNFCFEKKMAYHIFCFAGWSSFSAVAFTCYNTGLNLLLNMFFGPVVNAAKGITTQVQNAIQGFCRNFQVAINPQIIKSYASGDLDRVYNLIYAGTKFSFYLMLFLSLPIIFKVNTILSMWLTQVPAHTGNFIRFILAIVILDTYGNCLFTAMEATGKIRTYQVILGSIMLLILPVAYIGLKLGFPSESVFVVYFVHLLIVQIVSVFLVNKAIGLPINLFLKNVILRTILVTLISLIPSILVSYLFPSGMFSFILTCFVCYMSVLCSTYFIGLSLKEKLLFKKCICKILRKFSFLIKHCILK